MPGREVTRDGNCKGPFEFILCLMRQAAACWGPDVLFCKLQMVAFAYTPCVEGAPYCPRAGTLDSHPAIYRSSCSMCSVCS